MPLRVTTLASLLLAVVASAAEPDVRAVDVRGLRAGGTTTVTLDGDGFGPAPKLLLPFPAKQTLKPGGTDKKAVFDVALGPDVPAGYYHLRAVTDGGVSLPVLVGVDSFPQLPLAAPVKQLPVALHGSVSGSAAAGATFPGKAGQKVTVEVEAVRLGSKLRPVAHLYTAKRLQLAWSWPNPTLLGDTRLEATLPADGEYTVAVHDAEYAAAAPAFFRLKIGEWQYADLVFPPVAGAKVPGFELIGSAAVPAGKPEQLDARTAVVPWPKGTWSGPRPALEVSTRTELVEASGPGPHDLPAGPVGVSGKLSASLEEDRYRVPVTPGTKVRFEAFAERLGSPLDVSLVVRDEKGAQLARADDTPTSLDPVLEYAVPDKVTAVVACVLDAQGRGGPRGVYRLTVDPAKTGRPADFSLVTPARRLALTPGGKTVVPVFAERRGYSGAIALSAADLPAGAKLEGTTIPADADGALVTVHHGGKGAGAVLTRWAGTGGDLGRPVVLKGHPLERLQPWLATELAAAPVAAKADPFAIDWKAAKSDAALRPAQKLALPVTVTRSNPAAPVRLSLLVGQNPPVNPANNQPDPQRAIRADRAVELAAKAADGEMPVVVPPELPAAGYDFAVMAELLSADKTKVLDTAYTPVRRLPVVRPVSLKVASRFDAKRGATADLAGEVVRTDGFAGDVTVTLRVPAGFAAPAPATVKAGATAFTLKVAVPPTAAASEVEGFALSASAVPDPKQPNVRVKGREAELVLVLK